ncbi:hypothetical protein YC2023_008064 [Brassica napus]
MHANESGFGTEELGKDNDRSRRPDARGCTREAQRLLPTPSEENRGFSSISEAE